ncbi:hypothetical protein [Methanospirillum sp.]|uniref:hypothetical protein n=1 Tax=Methanospirillum sp. TaxID=45200 RepID=UPI002D1FA246|nr:hypothetical protein [Methanospirillum sp.]
MPACINGILLVIVGLIILREAYPCLLSPAPIQSGNNYQDRHWNYQGDDLCSLSVRSPVGSF